MLSKLQHYMNKKCDWQYILTGVTSNEGGKVERAYFVPNHGWFTKESKFPLSPNWHHLEPESLSWLPLTETIAAWRALVRRSTPPAKVEVEPKQGNQNE